MRLTPKTVRASIERLESLPFIRAEIDQIQDSLSIQRHKLDKVRNERKEKEGKLQTLKEYLQTLENQLVELTETDVSQKETELTDMESRLEAELITGKTLRHMIGTRKTDFLFVQKLVGERKDELEKIDSALVSIEFRGTTAEDENHFLQTQFRALYKEKLRAKSRLESETEKNYQELKSRGKLHLLLDEEKRFKTESRKTEAELKRLKRMEKALLKAEGKV